MPTRAGKSFTMSIAAVVYSIFNKNKKIGITGASTDKTGPIMQEVVNRFASNDIFDDFVMCDSSGLTKLERLRKEVSKKRITLKNGCEISIKSADLTQKEKGMGFMGWGFSGLVIVDETSLIPKEAYVKLYRMLLEHPDTQIVEIGNPWFLDHFYEHHHDDAWHKIHITWRDCVEAGRFTQEAVEDQKKNMSDLEFKVLMEADFPEELEFAIFSEDAVKNMIEYRDEHDFEKILIGIDVAQGGRDQTVITVFGKRGKEFYYLYHKEMNTREVMQIVGVASEMIEEYGKDRSYTTVDAIGSGAGVADRLRELKYHVTPFIAGSAARNSKRFYNKKTEAVFGVAQMAKDERIFNIPSNSRFTLEARSMIYEIRSDRQLKSVDPSKSPDYFDSMYLALSGEIYNDTPMFLGKEGVYNRKTQKFSKPNLFMSKARKR